MATLKKEWTFYIEKIFKEKCSFFSELYQWHAMIDIIKKTVRVYGIFTKIILLILIIDI